MVVNIYTEDLEQKIIDKTQRVATEKAVRNLPDSHRKDR